MFIKYDSIVIGSGFGGSVASLRLVEKWDFWRKNENRQQRAEKGAGRQLPISWEDAQCLNQEKKVWLMRTLKYMVIRIYITDGSVIQGNIGVNPALTITALSEYAMSKIHGKEDTVMTDISKQLLVLENEWEKKRSD